MPLARKTVLPQLIVTKTTDASTPSATRIELPGGELYYIKPDEDLDDHDGYHRGIAESNGRFNLFPVVLDRDGTPWAEANMWLLTRVIDAIPLEMGNYDTIADDLAKYREYLQDTGVDWTDFPENKRKRPTYRYNGHLKTAIESGELAVSTAKRRLSALIAFYTWLKTERLLVPEHAPWKASDRFVEVTGCYGKKSLKKVTTTDVGINVPKQDDPYVQTIDDGGKLRPLPKEEQKWLIDVLVKLGNYEMLLIHLFGLTSGARIQTILTARIRHFLDAIEGDDYDEVRLPVGPGTGIDTKGDKKFVLHIPLWVYKMLQVYVHSQAAKTRRERAAGGDHAGQYLFLSVRGAPMYQSKMDKRVFNPKNTLRYAKKGQPVRQFIRDYVLPLIRQQYPDFHYQFHDTRATYGMNLTDQKLVEVARGETSLHEAREYVKTRMGHESSAITDRYLKYRGRLKLVRKANSKYDEHLRKLVDQVGNKLP